MANSNNQPPPGNRSVVPMIVMAVGCILLIAGLWWRPAWILIGCVVSFSATLAIQLSMGFVAIRSGRNRGNFWHVLLASFSRLTFEGFAIWFVVVVFPPVLAAIMISWLLLVASQTILSRNKKWSAQRICIAAAECIFASVVGFAFLYWIYGIRNTVGAHHDPILSLYFSIVTWTTLGYGDFYPEPQVRLVAAIEALSAYCFMGVILGQLINAKSCQNSSPDVAMQLSGLVTPPAKEGGQVQDA